MAASPWTKKQVVAAFEQAIKATLGAFVGALTITSTSATGLEHSAIVAGIAAGVAFLTNLDQDLPSQ